MNKLRWGKFYWSDWSDDPALAKCSMAAQGLWMRLLCIAAQGTPYGHVNVDGKAPSTQDIAHHVRARPNNVAHWIAELVGNGVAAHGECGCLVSRRMVKDGKLAEKRRQAGAKRGGQNGGDTEATRGRHGVDSRSTDIKTNGGNPAENRQNLKNLHKQKERFAATELEADTDSVLQEGTESVSASQTGDAERVVRFDGARAQHRPPTDEETIAWIRKDMIRHDAG